MRNRRSPAPGKALWLYTVKERKVTQNVDRNIRKRE